MAGEKHGTGRQNFLNVKFFSHPPFRNRSLPLLTAVSDVLRVLAVGPRCSRTPRRNVWGAPSPERQPCPFPPRGPYLDTLENVLEGPGDDASLGRWVRQALHGEGLPAARLTIGKDGAIVALGDTLRGGTTSPVLSWPGPAGLGAPPRVSRWHPASRQCRDDSVPLCPQGAHLLVGSLTHASDLHTRQAAVSGERARSQSLGGRGQAEEGGLQGGSGFRKFRKRMAFQADGSSERALAEGRWSGRRGAKTGRKPEQH